MQQILLLGGGLSSSSLIQYLLENSETYGWKILIGDQNMDLIHQKINNHPNANAIPFDIENQSLLNELVSISHLVISMLPARFHPIVAETCLKFNKNMLTASYISPELRAMENEVKVKGLLFLNESGVDPGIDHMSAMQIIHRIQKEGGSLHSFKSSTGGLIAPSSDNNPWRYKFTWNPRNVIMAGQGSSQYIKNGRYKYIPYHKLFERTDRISVLDYGEFDVYANRDSLQYRSLYGLENIPTMFRGTMRRPGFCQAWNIFVQLGLTSDEFKIPHSDQITYREFINSFLQYDPIKPVELKVANYLGIDEYSNEMELVKWTGIFDDELIGIPKLSPAQILQRLLEKKWKLDPNDKDMIVMQHQFQYRLGAKDKEISSSMVVIGKDTTHTAMSITVGTPVAIAAKLILTGKIQKTGVLAPVCPEIYEPILKELESYGILFIEEERDL